MIFVLSPITEKGHIYSFKPKPAYRNKLFLYIVTITLGVWVTVAIILGFLIVILDAGVGSENFQNRLQLLSSMFGDIVFPGIILFTLISIVLSFVVIVYYVRAIEYTLDGTEVVVRKGIFNKTVTHIPFRVITNVSTRYGIYDRIFGIGTVEIETASGKSGVYVEPEAKIEGVRNFREIRDFILTSLRSLSGLYTTTTERAGIPRNRDRKFYHELYSTLKEIRDILS